MEKRHSIFAVAAAFRAVLTSSMGVSMGSSCWPQLSGALVDRDNETLTERVYSAAMYTHYNWRR